MNLESIAEAMKVKAAGVAPIGNTLKFDFGDDGTIYIDGTQGKNTVSMDDKDADCTIITTMENFVALTSGKLNPMMAMMSGKIKIKGDMGIAMKLQSLLA